ncbi:MAG: glycosyltransferase family protein [Elainellaceae cyanobacterium]
MGLGHKRRNLLIAQTLGASSLAADILMISGMRDATPASTPPGVDCLTLPALAKGIDGQYQSRRLDITLKEIVALRSQVIRTTIAAFKPDVLIVDNVPRGAVQELDPTLEDLRRNGKTRCILGLRDVLDTASAVQRDWERAANQEAIRDYYDAVWVYGDPTIYDMTQEYEFVPETIAKMHYMGYLDQRQRLKFVDNASVQSLKAANLPASQIVLGLVGGGQDGERLAEAFIQADLPPEMHGVLLTGPFMPARVRQRLQQQAAKRSNLMIVNYLAEPALLLNRADRIIAMGGYNTTCEILSFQKRALIVPRIQPRQEQQIRAERLQQLGLVDMLLPDQVSPQALTAWLAQADDPPLVRDRVDLHGLTRIPQFLAALLNAQTQQHAS